MPRKMITSAQINSQPESLARQTEISVGRRIASLYCSYEQARAGKAERKRFGLRTEVQKLQTECVTTGSCAHKQSPDLESQSATDGFLVGRKIRHSLLFTG